ncbi:uncharacterized protein LOC135137883 isoform X1 [Zophobas morio]|uniref:uncharacterized protein LOC135137883 isoform X1 n=1 Tax=Zophobas morio TaxID=2755281 RepID=UPI0030834946
MDLTRIKELATLIKNYHRQLLEQVRFVECGNTHQIAESFDRNCLELLEELQRLEGKVEQITGSNTQFKNYRQHHISYVQPQKEQITQGNTKVESQDKAIKLDVPPRKDKITATKEDQNEKNRRKTGRINKKFKKRRGTTDKGKEYELYFLAHMALKLTENDNINNFLISSNNEDFGDFDDVVLELENPRETYAIQLKHVQNKKCITIGDLTTTAPKANFAIKKYFESFKKESALRKCKLFLMTNAEFGVQGTFSIKTDAQEINIEVIESVCPLDIMNISQKGKCYQFKISENNDIQDLTNEVCDYEAFFENFFIYSKQLNLDALQKTIKSEFDKLLVAETANDVFLQYIHFVENWNMVESEKEKLDKTMMARLLALQIATPSICAISFETVNINLENAKYLQQAISKFHLTVFNSESCENVQSLWSNLKDEFDSKAINELNDERKRYHIKTKYVNNISELNSISGIEWAKLLWLMNKCPLILKESSCAYKAINICKDRSFVMVAKNFSKKELNDGSIFLQLSSIEDDNDLTNLKTNLECRFKSQTIKLEELTEGHKGFQRFISTDILLEMVQGPYEVKELEDTAQNLPLETWRRYVSRSLTRNFVDYKYLENIRHDTMVLITCVDDERILVLKKMLKLADNVDYDDDQYVIFSNKKCKVLNYKPTIYVSHEEFSSQQFRNICEGTSNVRNCHHFKLDNQENKLEWMATKGDISALQQYRIQSNREKNIPESELPQLHTENNVHIIADEPGMGKTYFLKKLKKDVSNFAIIITPKDISRFYSSRQNKSQISFKDFLLKSKFHLRGNFDSYFLKFLAKNGRFLYLWDGLDEISEARLNGVIDVILTISKGSSLQWITCRIHLEKLLEEKLGVLCKRIIRLNADQRQQYMMKSLEKKCSAKTFEEILEKIAFTGHGEIFGNPLQLFMVVTLLENNFDKYVTMLDHFKIITNLYRYFVDEKFNLCNKEKAELKILDNSFQCQISQDGKKARTKDYQAAALKILLDENMFNQLNLNCDDFLSDVASKGDYAGFINSVTESKHPTFVHNSYAEYFAADYLARNRKNFEFIICKIKHDNVRLFFDMMLAHNRPGHIAVLYQDLEALKQYDCEELCKKDDEGRNALELACTWGQRYPVLRVIKSNKTYLVEDYSDYSHETNQRHEGILKYLLSQFRVKDLLEMNCFSCAQKYECLFVLATIIKTCRIKSTTLSDNTICSILYYCVKYERTDFINLLEKNEDVLKIVSSAKHWLFLACQNGDEKLVRILLHFGIDLNCVDEEGRTPLHLAASRGHERIAQILLDKGAKLETLCENKNTLLHAACESGNEVLVEDLLKRGLNIDACNSDDLTPLHLACQNGFEGVVKVLISNRANPSATDKHGRTALYIALLEDEDKIVNLLIESGVDVNAVSEEGRTILHLASQNGHNTVVQKLMSLGAVPNFTDKNGLTPLGLSYQQSHEETSELLFSLGARINPVEENGNLLVSNGENFEHRIMKKPGITLPVAMSDSNFNDKTTPARNYRHMAIGDVIIDMMSNDKIKDFRISQKNDGLGIFDDVIIGVCIDNRKETSAMHLEFSGQSTLILQQLTKKNSNISLHKCFDSFQQMQSTTQEFILFVDCQFITTDNEMFQLEGEEFYIKFNKVTVQGSARIFRDMTHCYKLRIVEHEQNQENYPKIEKYRSFFEKFYIYTCETNFDNLYKATVDKFSKIFNCNKDIFEKVLQIISNWNEEKTGKLQLNKKFVQRIIALQLLTAHIVPITDGLVSDKMRILRNAISTFDVTLFENRNSDVIQQLWGDVSSQISGVEELNKIREIYQLSSDYIDPVDNLDRKILAQLLWLMNKCPLIVKDHENVTKVVQFCSDEKFVVLCEGEIRETIINRPVFQNLFDLKLKPEVYEKVTTTFTISLQGNEELNLKTAFENNETILKYVTTNDLLDMLDGPLCIGRQRETLCHPYIERHLSRTMVDIKYLDHIDDQTIVLLNFKSNVDQVDQLNKYNTTDIDDPNLDKSVPGVKIYVSKNKCSDIEFEKLCCSRSEINVIHYFKFFNNESLEWVRSKGDVSGIQKYKISNNNYQTENDFCSFDDIKNIIVISANPGMGKTELMTSLKRKCSPKYWTVTVYPKDVNLFLQSLEKDSTSNHIKLLESFLLNYEFVSKRNLDHEILKSYLKQRRVLYVWDAFDLITTQNLDKISNLIVELSQKGFVQLVNCRQHIKTHLEKKFGVISSSLIGFNEDEQEYYVSQRLHPSKSSDEIKNAIDKIKSMLAFVNAVDILGIPGEIFMLAELLLRNDVVFSKLLTDKFLVADLYKYLILVKFSTRNEVICDIKNYHLENTIPRSREKTLIHYERIALKASFPDEILQPLKLDFQLSAKVIYSNKTCLLGLITEVRKNVPHFFHVSYAEYLVAAYFSKNLSQVPKEVLFDGNYTNIRFFFDTIMALNSPAHIAVLYKNFEQLNTYGDDILTRKDRGGRSALHLLCYVSQEFPRSEKNYLEAVGNLLDKCSVAEQDVLFNMTPLAYACEREARANSKTGNSGSTSRVLESLNDHERVAAYLVDCEGQTSLGNFCIRTPLYVAAESGQRKLAKYLMESGAEINRVDDDGCTPLFAASRNDHVKTVECLVKCGAQINRADNVGRTPLFAASLKGQEKMVENLVKCGAAINCVDKYGWTPLYAASRNGHYKIVECLAKCGAEINRTDGDGGTPLYKAAWYGHEKTVECLVKLGAEINRAHHNGETPLYAASWNGHEKIIEYLVKCGTEINRGDNSGRTPLHAASSDGQDKTIECLVKFGAEINRADKNDWTPLYGASRNGHDKTVECLVKCGADVNRADYIGWTPLFVACSDGHEKTVECLVKCGAEINRADEKGRTPLDVAISRKHKNVVDFLVSKSAKTQFVKFSN